MDTRRLGDPGTADFHLEKYPFYLLNRLVARYNVVIEERLRGIGLDIPYWRVLMILGEHSPRGIRDIADAAVINLSTMTRIIQRMTAAGLLNGVVRKRDNRVTDISLTETGKAKLAEARAATSPVYWTVIDGFAEREVDALIDALNRLHDNLAGEEGQPRGAAPGAADLIES